MNNMETNTKDKKNETVNETAMATLEKFSSNELATSTTSDTLIKVPALIQRGTIYLISFILIAALAILYFGKVSVIVSAKGKVIPEEGNFNVRAMESGIVVDILAKEGDTLKAGATLISIEPAVGISENIGLSNKKIASTIQSIRQLTDQIDYEQKELENKKNRLKEVVNLVERGLLSKMEYENEKERLWNVEIGLKNKQKQISELNLQKMNEEIQIKQSLKQTSFQKVNMPFDGKIVKMNLQHIGQTISQNSEVAVIEPLNSSLIILGLIENKDVGFVKVGQPVIIKLDAYPFQQFGTLDGTILQILQDITNEGKFIVKVKPNKLVFYKNELEMKVFAGLTSELEIVTGEQRLINLLFSDKDKKEAK
jgi:multidrug resistance efflux pump